MWGDSELVSDGGRSRDSPRPSGGMADAVDSKSTEGNLVRVRLSPRASFNRNNLVVSHYPALCKAFFLRLSPILPFSRAGATYPALEVQGITGTRI